MTIHVHAKIALALSVGLLLSACERAATPTEEHGELAWARAALARNPTLEVIAVDEQAGVITVREKRDGTVQAIKLADLAAISVAELTAKLTAPMAQTSPPITTQPSSGTSTAVANTTADASTDAAQVPPADADQNVAAAAPPPSTDKAYTIERTDGQVKVTGPGVSIVSTGAAPSAAQRAERGQTTAPIICEGRRMLHLDNRNLNVEGDGITARGGCELYLTNSRVVASGTGIRVADATVHISNSYVEGAQNSVDAGSDAKLVVRDSTFKGLSRRDERATLLDQGGNRWR
jgi:hypothetical protein